MAEFYLARGNLRKARDIGKKMIEQVPASPLGQQLLDYVERMEQ